MREEVSKACAEEGEVWDNENDDEVASNESRSMSIASMTVLSQTVYALFQRVCRVQTIVMLFSH